MFSFSILTLFVEIFKIAKMFVSQFLLKKYVCKSKRSKEGQNDNDDSADLNLWNIGQLSMWKAMAPPPSPLPPSLGSANGSGGKTGGKSPLLVSADGGSAQQLLTLPNNSAVWFDEEESQDYTDDY